MVEPAAFVPADTSPTLGGHIATVAQVRRSQGRQREILMAASILVARSSVRAPADLQIDRHDTYGGPRVDSTMPPYGSKACKLRACTTGTGKS